MDQQTSADASTRPPLDSLQMQVDEDAAAMPELNLVFEEEEEKKKEKKDEVRKGNWIIGPLPKGVEEKGAAAILAATVSEQTEKVVILTTEGASFLLYTARTPPHHTCIKVNGATAEVLPAKKVADPLESRAAGGKKWSRKGEEKKKRTKVHQDRYSPEEFLEFYGRSVGWQLYCKAVEEWRKRTATPQKNTQEPPQQQQQQATISPDMVAQMQNLHQEVAAQRAELSAQRQEITAQREELQRQRTSLAEAQSSYPALQKQVSAQGEAVLKQGEGLAAVQTSIQPLQKQVSVQGEELRKQGEGLAEIRTSLPALMEQLRSQQEALEKGVRAMMAKQEERDARDTARRTALKAKKAQTTATPTAPTPSKFIGPELEPNTPQQHQPSSGSETELEDTPAGAKPGRRRGQEWASAKVSLKAAPYAPGGSKGSKGTTSSSTSTSPTPSTPDTAKKSGKGGKSKKR